MKRFMGKQPALKGVFKDFVEVFIGVTFPQQIWKPTIGRTWTAFPLHGLPCSFGRGILVVGTMASLQNFAWFTI